MEETQNLSNNLIMVTMIKRPSEDVDMDEDDQNAAPVIIEKVSEALRTSHTCQLSTSLNFKPTPMSIA